MRSAWARASDRLGLATTTSMGVGDPKLITSLTMSPGSKPNVTRSAWARASCLDNPCCWRSSASQGFTFSGNTLRSRSRNAARRIPLPSRRATRICPSSGARMNRIRLFTE